MFQHYINTFTIEIKHLHKVYSKQKHDNNRVYEHFSRIIYIYASVIILIFRISKLQNLI